MSLTHAAFALAGLIAAAGPVVIHLLNRRRFRTVEWGAMAFLRKAMLRSRKAVRLRDVALLVLRTAAVLLFGLALARPSSTGDRLDATRFVLVAAAALAFFGGAIGVAIVRSRRRRSGWGMLSIVGVIGLVLLLVVSNREAASMASEPASSRQPVHAIFVLDNSRSMGTRTLGGTLLEAAKQRAESALVALPPGSRISVLPLCGPERSYTLDAHRHIDDARAAIERIAITDRAGSALRMLSLAAEAARRVPELAAKRIVFLGDQQASGWPREGLVEAVETAGGPVHVVQVAGASEGRASGGTPNVWIEGFSVQDGLAEASLPATFLGTVRCAGETAVTAAEVILSIDGTAVASQTVDLRPGQVRDVTLTAPIDVMATAGGTTFVAATMTVRVTDPATNRLDRDDARHLAVPVVTELPVVFVDQWGTNESLDAGRVGETYRLRRLLAPRPAEGVYEPLVSIRHVTVQELDEETLADARLVVIAGVERPSDEAVLLLRPYVEQGGRLVIAAGANFDPAAWTAAAWLDGEGILPAPLAETAVGVRPSQATATWRIEPFRLDVASLDHPYFRIEGVSAEVLAELWRQPFFFQAVAVEAGRTQAFGVEGSRKVASRVLGRFSKSGGDGNGLPYVVEARIGDGRIVMLTAGISSDWDTLAQTNAIVLLDRITRSLLEETLPRRTFEAGDVVTLPVERRPDVTYGVTPPDSDEPRPVSVDATGTGYSVRLDDTSIAGHYAVASRRESGDAGGPLATTLLAVSAPAAESDLTPLTPDQLAERVGDAEVRLVGPDDEISFVGDAVGGDGVWKWFAGAVLACLMGEMAVAGWSRPERGEGRQ